MMHDIFPAELRLNGTPIVASHTHLLVMPVFRVVGGWKAWLVAFPLVPAWYVWTVVKAIVAYLWDGHRPWSHEPCGAERCWLLVLGANRRTWVRLPNPWHCRETPGSGGAR